jgi:hypothetical protein
MIAITPGAIRLRGGDPLDEEVPSSHSNVVRPAPASGG